MKRSRIAQLATVYERMRCQHGKHGQLDPEALDLVLAKTGELTLRLDVLCRAALVLRGIEHYSPGRAASMLGVSRTAVEAAYCRALHSIDVLTCEALMDLDIYPQQCC